MECAHIALGGVLGKLVVSLCFASADRRSVMCPAHNLVVRGENCMLFFTQNTGIFTWPKGGYQDRGKYRSRLSIQPSMR